MGLDMYLEARRFLSRYNDDDQLISAAVSKLPIAGCAGLRPTGLVFDVMYWRKANAIHGWFVDHCQDQVDDCRYVDVSVEQLQDLRDVCKKVLDDHSLASTLLPTRGGCFFGSTDYDEHYFADVQKTHDTLTRVLGTEMPNQCDFYYHASW